MVTAISLWIVVGGALALYIGWSALAIVGGANPWPYVLGAPAIYATLLVSIAAWWFALAWRFRSPRPPAMQIGLGASMRLFWNEVSAIASSGPRMALFRWLVPDPPPHRADAPVLLLHGVLCNAGMWMGFRNALIKRGLGPVYALSYGPPLASIDDFADQVAAKIDDILRATGASRVAIVGHSMGGLVARAYRRRYGDANISMLMTLGTPHHGSVHARFFPGTCLRQLRPGNAWLAELNRSERPSAAGRLISLWSWHDSMVAPQASSRLTGAHNIELTGIGHTALIGDDQVIALVAAELGRIARDAKAYEQAPLAVAREVASHHQ
jgi:triacylglycerol esterase/lipase EstA (alpha/beta hydrolase family)